MPWIQFLCWWTITRSSEIHPAVKNLQQLFTTIEQSFVWTIPKQEAAPALFLQASVSNEQSRLRDRASNPRWLATTNHRSTWRALSSTIGTTFDDVTCHTKMIVWKHRWVKPMQMSSLLCANIAATGVNSTRSSNIIWTLLLNCKSFISNALETLIIMMLISKSIECLLKEEMLS